MKEVCIGIREKYTGMDSQPPKIYNKNKYTAQLNPSFEEPLTSVSTPAHPLQQFSPQKEELENRPPKKNHLFWNNYLDYKYSNTHFKCYSTNDSPFKPDLSLTASYKKKKQKSMYKQSLNPSKFEIPEKDKGEIPINRPKKMNSERDENPINKENENNNEEDEEKPMYNIQYRNPEIHNFDVLIGKIKKLKKENYTNDKELTRLKHLLDVGSQKLRENPPKPPKRWGINNEFQNINYFTNELRVTHPFSYEQDLENPLKKIRDHYNKKVYKIELKEIQKEEDFLKDIQGSLKLDPFDLAIKKVKEDNAWFKEQNMGLLQHIVPTSEKYPVQFT